MLIATTKVESAVYISGSRAVKWIMYACSSEQTLTIQEDKRKGWAPINVRVQDGTTFIEHSEPIAQPKREREREREREKERDPQFPCLPPPTVVHTHY